MAGLQELRSRAKALGIPGSLIRKHMNDAAELENLIAGFEKGKAHVKLVKKMKSNKGGTPVRKPVARAKAKAKAKAAPQKRKAAPVKRSKPVMVKRTTATKPKRTSARTTARKTTARKVTPKTTARKPARKVSVDESGRNTIDRVNFSNTDGWNPREGSAVEAIWLALKKAKGDRDRAFDLLKADVWDFVGKTKADGSKRPRSEEPGGAYHMLRYRISRTLFDFAVQTGQHESSTNRKDYEFQNGNKSKPKRKAAVKAATKRTPTRTTAKARTTKTAAPKRGRPKGSTNKPKATTTSRRRTTSRRTASKR